MNRTAALPRLLLSLASWDSAVEASARRIPFDFPGDYVSWLAGEAYAGRSAVHRIECGGRVVGHVVVTVQDAPAAGGSRELIVQAVCGQDGAAVLTAELLGLLDGVARSQGCATVRFHTIRRPIVNVALAQGFRISEIVMRREVIS